MVVEPVKAPPKLRALEVVLKVKPLVPLAVAPADKQVPLTAKQPLTILIPLAAVVVPPVIIRLPMVPVARVKLVENRLVEEEVVA